MDDERRESQETRYGLAELADAAGVSIRTVRYYIAEGLLPPPEGAGPRSAYTTGHLDRLGLIGRLKDAYLPLREIRRRLDGLDDAAVRALLRQLGPGSGGRGREEAEPETGVAPAPPESAAAYLDRVMGRRPAAGPPVLRATARLPSLPAPAVGFLPPATEEADEAIAGTFGRAESGWGDEPEAASSGNPPPLDLDPALALSPPAEIGPAIDGPWRRVSLGPDAELLVREDAYQRRRDRVEWLVGWAKKVFGG